MNGDWRERKRGTMFGMFNDKKWVTRTPLLTTLCLEYGNVGQLWRMWTERTAAGQSLWSWLAVWVALLLWCNFYRVMLPTEKFALRCTQLGVGLNTCVWLTVIWFRYFA